MRTWLADQPGALGALASALGDIGVDLIGIEILERDGGRVVDELMVDVPELLEIDELARAVSGVPGVQLEDVRSLVHRLPYPGSDPLDLAVTLGEQRTTSQLADALAVGVANVFAGDWAAVLSGHEGDGSSVVAVAGQPPAAGWVTAFVSGASRQAVPTSGELRGPRDVAWAQLHRAGASVVVGRGGPPFRTKERHQLVQLCQVADGRWQELSLRSGMKSHPSMATSSSPVAATPSGRRRAVRHPAAAS
jgi:hypothetical protein